MQAIVIPKNIRERKDPNRLHQKVPRTLQSRTQKILSLARTGRFTCRQIADIVSCTHSNVHQTLKKYNLKLSEIVDFRVNKADVLAGYQVKILKAMTDEKIKDAPVIQLSNSLKVINEIERLHTGQSTANVATVHADIAELRGADSGGNWSTIDDLD